MGDELVHEADVLRAREGESRHGALNRDIGSMKVTPCGLEPAGGNDRCPGWVVQFPEWFRGAQFQGQVLQGGPKERAWKGVPATMAEKHMDVGDELGDPRVGNSQALIFEWGIDEGAREEPLDSNRM